MSDEATRIGRSCTDMPQTHASSAEGLPLEPERELPSECVERILWFVSRETEGDPRVIRSLARISKSWKRAADENATYAAMVLHRYGIEDLALPFTRHRVDWGLNGGTLNRAPNREHALIDPAKIGAVSYTHLTLPTILRV